MEELKYFLLRLLYYFSAYNPLKGKALRIRSISLRKILKENNLENPYLLKADCKGCEYHIIEDDTISKFEKVKIEYAGVNRPKVDYIINKLKKQGFRKFRIFKHNCGIYHLQDHGTIYMLKFPLIFTPTFTSTSSSLPTASLNIFILSFKFGFNSMFFLSQ